MVKVIVRRETWLRGEGTTDSKLLRDRDLKQCCLGFACEAMGIPRSQIFEKPMVWGLSRFYEAIGVVSQLSAPAADGVISDILAALAAVNDVEANSTFPRELILRILGQQINIQFEFLGGEAVL